jgi:predicted aconitase with swiveling domain
VEEMAKTKILRGVTRSEGTAEGEALVSRQPISHFMYDIENDTGIIRMVNHELNGKSVAGKVLVYPSAIGPTGGASGLFLKAKVTKVGPKAIICRRVDPIDIAGALAGEIPAVDGFREDPLKEIETGDWVEVKAEKVGGKAIIKITRNS